MKEPVKSSTDTQRQSPAVPVCPRHGLKHRIEQRGIGCTKFRCDRCAWKSGELLTEIFK